MKIIPEHINYMRAAILANSSAPNLAAYTARGLSEKRWRWDLLWAAKISPWISKNIYPYADDSHIDTALKFILKSDEFRRKANPSESGEARELFLFATNDGQLYRSRITPIIENLKKKSKKGVYDKTLAVKLWRYAADDAAKRYNNEYESVRSGYGIFTVAIRNEVAQLLNDYYADELREANPVPRSSVARKKAINKFSQMTGRAPTARLKKRRAKNTERGYFPNPAPAQNIEFEVFVYAAIKKATTATGSVSSRQAKLSYAQGLITAGQILNALTRAEAQLFLMQLRPDGVIGNE